MPLLSTSITELTTTTLRELGRMRWSMISNSLQEYHAMGRFLKRGKVDIEDGGYGLQWNVQVADSGTAERSSLYDTDAVRTADTMVTATRDWVHMKFHYAMDKRVLSMNKGSARIVDMWQAQRVAALVDAAALLETDFWSAPDANDTTKPTALRYYVVKNNTDGFNGGHASGFSNCAGISQTTYANWANFTHQYTTVSRTDLIRHVKRALRYTKFMPPVEHPNYTGSEQRFGLYTVDDVYNRLGELAEDQNQNIGADLATYEGRVTIGRVPCYWVPQIDSDTDDPVYGIDWSSFRPAVLRGEYLRETQEDSTATSHNMQVVWVDLTYQYRCYDRRRNFVLATGAN